MRLTVIGCAGSAPAPDSACSSYLIEHEGYHLLLDLGAGASGPLQKYVRPSAVDAVMLSHGHSDHHADLTQLWRLREVDKAGPLAVTGPSDMPEVLRTNPDSFTPTVATEGPVSFGPIAARLARVAHGECWATRIGDALCYTADTGPCEAIEELADGVGVLLAEASGFDGADSGPVHLTAGDAARLAVKAGVRLLVLTHVRAWHDPAELLAEAQGIAKCPVVVAVPGLRVGLVG